MEAVLEAMPTEDSTPEPVRAPAADPRADYVISVLKELSHRQRLRALAVLYNAPKGLETDQVAATLGEDPEAVQPVLDRLAKAGLASVLPVLDDASLGWATRHLATPAAREWLERVALANGRECVVPG